MNRQLPPLAVLTSILLVILSSSCSQQYNGVSDDFDAAELELQEHLNLPTDNKDRPTPVASARTLIAAAELFDQKGESKPAEKLYRRALEILEAEVTKDNKYTRFHNVDTLWALARAQADLGALLLSQKNFRDGNELMEHAQANAHAAQDRQNKLPTREKLASTSQWEFDKDRIDEVILNYLGGENQPEHCF